MNRQNRTDSRWFCVLAKATKGATLAPFPKGADFMKKILSLILFLILCFGAFVSCDNETQTESSSESTQESISKESSFIEPVSSELFLGRWNYENPTRETLTGVNSESFNSYVVYLHSSYHSLVDDDNWTSRYHYATKLFLSYEEFLGGVAENCVFDAVTEQTFENNYVLVVEGESGHIRSEDIYYSNLVKENECYTLTYNLISRHGQGFSDAIQHYSDIVIVPKTIFKNESSSVKIEVVKKEYVFDTLLYNSSCEVTTYLPE